MEEIETDSGPSSTSSDTTVDAKHYDEFIGFNIESRMKHQLSLQASLDGVGLSQWIREVLQMELLRLTKGEASSREMLIRERRIRSVTA